ncbi:MAG TPA: glycoside hydrolase family 43 protein [Fibrobacteria bacterium]|nr:glycoside hydrolase family 43 protein [Fibrobacteria bacterium]
MKTCSKPLACLLLSSTFAVADNPIVQTYFTPDPAPMVWKDTVYVYTGHDEDVTVDNFFTMNDYRVYSTTDMVNWRDHGSPLGYKSFSWSQGKAWAAQCIPRNGKFYWYATIGKGSGKQPTIAVAVSDRPTGPFKDPINKPLASQSWDDIDPTVFIDNDDQAYLMWGNPKLYWVKLNEDMISYSGNINVTNMTTDQFGTRPNGTDRKTTYEEGPWIFRRKDLYYMVYAAGPLPEPIGYSTSSKPTGPWTYRGEIMSGANTGSFTNHSGIVEFKGKGYFFYHTGKLSGGGGYKRSTAVEEFDFNPDGSIPKISMTNSGPKPVANLNPYQRVEGETMAFSSGLKTQGNDQSGVYVSSISNNDYIKIRSVDFSSGGAKTFTASVGATSGGGSIELHLGSTSGKLIGTLPVTATGGMTSWKSLTTTISGATGVNDLFLVFKGGSGDLFTLDWWQFEPTVSSVSPTPLPRSQPTDHVDVRDPSGAMLRSRVPRERALSGLKPGIYLVDQRKVVVASD